MIGSLMETVTTAVKELGKNGLESMKGNIPDFSKSLGDSEVKPRVINKGEIPVFSKLQSNFLPYEIGQNGEKQGEWSGERGNSDWIPDDDYTPKNPKSNPDGLTWKEIKEKYGVEKITFKDGEPDFSEVSEGTVEIDDFTEERDSNFTQADEKLAEKWTNEGKDGKEWSPDDVRKYRKENKLTWHERSDQKTLDLVPTEIHGNVPHSGGISAAKNGGN